jgi:hypothetical protein
MRVIILSALFAVGVGLAGMGGASAAIGGNGINNAANASSLLEEVQWRRRDRFCRSVTVCRRGPFGRRCHVERVCRR